MVSGSSMIPIEKSCITRHEFIARTTGMLYGYGSNERSLNLVEPEAGLSHMHPYQSGGCPHAHSDIT